ncbi:unnamed protein product [Ilex paraguariensis]|uniref:Uncharacterized protein n=1 Tax=Ilex paraguariensis TaxID=185542 RepID=A0ABC8SNI1_9AQUA
MFESFDILSSAFHALIFSLYTLVLLHFIVNEHASNKSTNSIIYKNLNFMLRSEREREREREKSTEEGMVVATVQGSLTKYNGITGIPKVHDPGSHNHKWGVCAT